MRQLEGKVDHLQRTAEALAEREEATRAASGSVGERLARVETALQETQVELDAVRCGGDSAMTCHIYMCFVAGEVGVLCAEPHMAWSPLSDPSIQCEAGTCPVGVLQDEFFE